MTHWPGQRDEFVIVLTDLTSDTQAAVERVAQKCLQVFEETFIIHGVESRLGTSIGLTFCESGLFIDQSMVVSCR